MGKLLEMKDPRGNTWKFKYDDMGRLVSQTDPLQNTTAYEYDGANNRTAIINALLKRFDFEYDDHNNLIKAIDPYTKYVTTDYNSDDLPVRLVDQEGKQTVNEYDNEARLRKSVDGADNEILYHYDETQSTTVSSYLPVQIDFPTYSRRMYYDALQGLVRTTDILDASTSHTSSYEYDAAGNVVAETDEENRRTVYDYDALNRLIRVTDAMNGVVERAYDNRGNLLTVKDPEKGITAYEYDRNNRLKKITRPMLQTTSYDYDAAGNKTAVVDAKGQRIEYSYNAVNRLTQVRYFAAGDHANPVKVVDFAYDNLGNLLTYDDGTTSGAYTYDDLSRKLLETVNYGTFIKSIGYEYYANGTKKGFTGPDGTTYRYSYDPNNQVSSINIPGVGQITYNTYQWTRPTLMTLPGGTRKEMSYDPLMRIKQITAKDPGGNAVLNYQYGYDRMDNIVNKATEHGPYMYNYDGLYRLASAVSSSLPQENYTYDPVGNRLTSATANNWTYNPNNELQSYNGVTFQYDLNGNTTQKSDNGTVQNFLYNEDDRLTEVKDGIGAIIAVYYYDPFGRKLWKEVGGARTNFMYADEGLIAEFDGTGSEIKSYGYAPNSTWTTNPVFMQQGTQYYFYHNDHLGAPQKMTSGSGAVVWSAKYESFGKTEIDPTSSLVNNLRFPGQYYD